MKVVTTYSVKIKEKDLNKVFSDTAKLYRAAVDFFVNVLNVEWKMFSEIRTGTFAVKVAEELSVTTKSHPMPKYDFSTKFYKFPSYLRRSAISEAFGKVSSYRSNLANWEASDPRLRGAKPSAPRAGYVYPAMYKDNCYIRTGEYTARVKVFIRNTWDWVDVTFRKSDADYIARHCKDRDECCPTLQKRGKQWFLDFPFEKSVKLETKPVNEQIAIAVDLGLNNCCTCVAMGHDGTIFGRHFLSLPKEYDCLKRKLSHIRYSQRHGSRDVSGLWRIAKGVNDSIAVKTAQFIIDVAIFYSADVIVFEHLDLIGKKKGSSKQKLALWKARYVQSIVTAKAHMLKMRISHVNAWGTSKLAFDGSGYVKRGKDSEKTGGNYSLCEFSTGKVYNCDLNAAYNIGSRYFVREIGKSMPATEWQRITAKVPQCAKRSTCTLSTLINLYAELCAAA